MIVAYIGLWAITIWKVNVIFNEFTMQYESLATEVSQLEKQKQDLIEEKGLLEGIIEESNQERKVLIKELDHSKQEIKKLELDKKKEISVSRSQISRNLGEFTITCYDLSVESCGKPIGSKGYGITASGKSLIGHTWQSAKAIAVDPKVIPLGSKVELTFTNNKYRKYNGIYTCIDTGGAIKGNKIDFFLGDFNQNKTHQDVWDFGKTTAKVKVLK